MKRVLPIILILLLLIPLSGCGGDGASGAPSPNNSPAASDKAPSNPAGSTQTATPSAAPEKQAEEITDGTFTILSLDGDTLTIRLEKSSVVSRVELSAKGEKLAATGYSNLDSSMQITQDGYQYGAGRLACTFELPAGFVPDTLYITAKKDTTPVEFDISALASGAAAAKPAVSGGAASAAEPDGVLTVKSVSILGTLEKNTGMYIQGGFSPGTNLTRSTGNSYEDWFFDCMVTDVKTDENSKLVSFGDQLSLITGEDSFIIASLEHDGGKYTVKIGEGVELNCVLDGDTVKILFDESYCKKI